MLFVNFMKSFYVNTSKDIDLILLSHEVRTALREVKAETGNALVIVPFPGAGLVVLGSSGEDMEGLRKGLREFHQKCVVACFLPKCLVLPIDKGRLIIEPWQEIYLVDYEIMGKRRELQVKFTPDVQEAKKPS